MQGVDTNILVYAHREECTQHATALSTITSLATGNDLWCIAWPSMYEFLRVVTHPKIFTPPSTLKQALGFLNSVIESPCARLLGHGREHWHWMSETVISADARANVSFDAQIAALFLEHGVQEIVTADSDFLRFRKLLVKNPFE